MGKMKTYWLFAYEQWGGLRPAYVIDERGRVFVPVAYGFWIRRFFHDLDS